MGTMKNSEYMEELTKEGKKFYPDRIKTVASNLCVYTLKKYFLKGIYLTEPSPRLMLLNEKTLIVKRRAYTNMTEVPLWLCSNGLCYGIISLTDSKLVNKEVFTDMYKEHLITDKERTKRFGNSCNEFYVFNFKTLVEFDFPLPIEHKSGFHNFVKHISFKEKPDPYMYSPTEDGNYDYTIREYEENGKLDHDLTYKINGKIFSWELLDFKKENKVDLETMKFGERVVVKAIKNDLSDDFTVPVYKVIDKGKCEIGANKLNYHELFLSSDKFNGRLTLQQHPSSGNWLAIQPKDQTPYVLSSDAIKKAWLPLYGVSALPEKTRNNIPDNLIYWKERNAKKALKLRKNLVNKEGFNINAKQLNTKSSDTVFIKSIETKQVAYFCVAQPEILDSQGEKWIAEELETAAHLYMAGEKRLIDVEHNYNPKGKFQVVEGWVLKDDWKLPNGTNLKKGSFCVGIHFSDMKDFNKVKNGTYLGISPSGIKR